MKNKTTPRIIREPWLTKGHMKSSSKLDKLYKNHLKHPKNSSVQITFKSYRNKKEL